MRTGGMSAYFCTPKIVEALRQSAQSWIGTPFHPHARAKGSGVSCQTLAAGIYQETGFLPHSYVAPEASLKLARTKSVTVVDEFVAKLLPPGLTKVGTAEPGDLLGFLLGGQIHFGVYLGQRFIHCLHTTGVIYSRFDDATYLQRLARVWRPTV